MQLSRSISIFWVISCMQLGKQMAYRFNFLIPYLLRVFQLFVSFSIWKQLFQYDEAVRGYTLESMKNYLVFSQLTAVLFEPSHIFSLQGLIKNGSLSIYLLRPCSYILHAFSQFFGSKCIHLVIFLFVFLLSTLFQDIDSHFMFQKVLLLILSFTLSFSFGFFISTWAFYLTEMWPIKYLFAAAMAIFGGILFPLDVLPKWISSWAPYTPFAYFSYVNVKVLYGAMTKELLHRHLLNSIFLNVFFFGLARISFFFGLKKYRAVGC